MKKTNVLRHLPLLKQYKKDMKAKDALVVKLEKELSDLEEVINDLEDVTVHLDFPINVNEVAESPHSPPSTEVFSACDESSRNAYISRDSSPGETPERWRATGYKEEGTGEGKVLVEGVSRNTALKAGKDYVATGKVSKAETGAARAEGAAGSEGPKKRGRKPKVTA